MKTHCKIVAFATSILLLSLLAACAAPTPQPPGTVTGKMMYKHLTKGVSAEPIPNVLIALCRVPAEGLPEGPTVASRNGDKTQHICTLQRVPTVRTDAEGTFTLDGVPPASYLVMFHLFPAEVEGVEWNGVGLTEAPFNEADQVVPPSGKSDFWERGGAAIAVWNWSAAEGGTVSMGNVCSNKFGFCFSILYEHPYPVIEVKPNETVEAELTAHFKSEE